MKQTIIGWQSLEEALAANKPLSKVWIAREAVGKHQRIVARLDAASVPYQIVPRRRLGALLSTNTGAGQSHVHQGVVAETSPLHFADLGSVVLQAYERSQVPLVVACDGLSDVRNIGAVARTAVAVRATALLLSTKKSARINADSVKASAGAMLHIPLCRSHNMVKSLKMLHSSGLQLVLADHRATTCYADMDYRLPTALIMGSEHEGVQAAIAACATHRVRIPVQVVDSLNASVAAAVLLYEVWRQRRSLSA